MNNGRVPSNAPTVPHAIPFRSTAAAERPLGPPPGSTALRLTRRGHIVRATLIVGMILLVALVAGLFAGGISGLI
ncbi:MAG TPA: hypothetical protein VN767_29945 [Streptosporangiaceae bacterium]|jgi:hypothetical protein|nr:hypothetical protein [Streptosporangiaceae bacterium]